MSGPARPMSSQPARYWAFRNLVTVVQILIVCAVVAGAVSWAISDGNAARVWGSFYDFSQGISRWAHENLHYPWG